MTPSSESPGASRPAGLERMFVPLIAGAGLLGLVLPGPERTAVDHGAVNTVLVILVLASAASVPTGAGRRLRASARRLAVVLVLSTVVLGAGAWVVSQLV